MRLFVGFVMQGHIYDIWHPCVFKMAAIPTNFHHISAYSRHTVVVLMAIPRFLGSRNPMEQSFTHRNARKRTWRPFCFSKWPLIQPILDIVLSQPRMFAELRTWGYTKVFWPENRLEQLFVWDRLCMKDGIHIFQNGCHSNKLSSYLSL